MAKILKETLKTIEQYKSMNPHYVELLDILEEILILREAARRRMRRDIFNVNDDLVQKKLEGGLPLIDFAQGGFDLDESKKYFLSLLKIAEKRTPEETKEVIERLEDGTIDYAEMICDSFSTLPCEEASDEDDENVFDLLGFLIEESLRPALEVISEKYGKIIEKSQWSEGYCPVCSREPKIGELKDEEGRRYLFCSQCGLEWPYKRIKCPFCGNEDQQALAYFTIEDEEKYRVDVCNECKRYIKTVDLRDTKGEVNLDVEDIATLHLDILANDEGYE
ncbi:MAG: formate dehydrogenase accessory protein FdhE [Syntrophobacterales bacterium]|nr:MAG: formate dehydrogenase accessory protein FdhE [Syntrophobacterales bacterium]